ncbi:MAG: helix-turn-helix transcriptional regulator [Gammaproteobacteria bacterium]|nr:helix-turn-helix transcriptional regulator [Gammaproteobacteria bacterium]
MKLHHYIRQLRRQLGFKQADMKMRIGMNQQQYQRIEAGENANLESIQRIAEGLNAELVLVPKDKLSFVRELIDNNIAISSNTMAKDYDIWSNLFDNKDQP